MNKERPALIEHYPYAGDTKPSCIRKGLIRQVKSLISELPDRPGEENDLSEYLIRHIILAESLFGFEEEAQDLGEEYANLYYHGKKHAVYQTTYDTLYIVRSILKREDALSAHLSPEGAVAAVLAAAYHDTGYVNSHKLPCNFAARTPIHVEEGIKTAMESLDKIEIPEGLDFVKIRKYLALGIYSTSFPFTKDHQVRLREELDLLEPEQRREAQIVRLTVQLADLGGQTARVDYSSRLVYRLREELDCINPGLGEKIIGEDQEVQSKSAGFIQFVVEPSVGKIANALLGTKDHQFAKAWKMQKYA